VGQVQTLYYSWGGVELVHPQSATTLGAAMLFVNFFDISPARVTVNSSMLPVQILISPSGFLVYLMPCSPFCVPSKSSHLQEPTSNPLLGRLP
jgi:hypothetical protein